MANCAFPLGGYVKFLGDKNPASGPNPKIDFDDEQVFLRKSMHGAPLWARFMTVLLAQCLILYFQA